MKSGRIAVQLVRGAGPLSCAIAWWGNGWNGWSHADGVMHDGWLIGARSDQVGHLRDGKPAPPGIQERQPDYEKWLRRTVFWKDVPASRADKWEQLEREKLETPYDRPGIWRLITDKQPVADGWWFCSAYQINRLQIAGEVRTDLCKPPQQTTPDDLGFALSVLGWNQEEMPV